MVVAAQLQRPIMFGTSTHQFGSVEIWPIDGTHSEIFLSSSSAVTRSRRTWMTDVYLTPSRGTKGQFVGLSLLPLSLISEKPALTFSLPPISQKKPRPS